MRTKAEEALFFVIGMVIVMVYGETEKLWVRLAALFAAVLLVLVREKRATKQVYYQMLRSSMLYACLFGGCLLSLPFPEEEPFLPPHYAIFLGVIATVYFVMDFAKLHKAHERAQRRRQP